MRVSELIEQLKNLPPETEVMTQLKGVSNRSRYATIEKLKMVFVIEEDPHTDGRWFDELDIKRILECRKEFRKEFKRIVLLD